jgi:hypothetical protein
MGDDSLTGKERGDGPNGLMVHFKYCKWCFKILVQIKEVRWSRDHGDRTIAW